MIKTHKSENFTNSCHYNTIMLFMKMAGNIVWITEFWTKFCWLFQFWWVQLLFLILFSSISPWYQLLVSEKFQLNSINYFTTLILKIYKYSAWIYFCWDNLGEHMRPSKIRATIIIRMNLRWEQAGLERHHGKVIKRI